jgi:hypothetical protein
MFDISANSVTVDLEVANAAYIDIGDATGDFNVLLVNPPAFDNYGEVVIDFIQEGDHNAIWESSVRWPGGTAPVLSSGSMNRDTIHLWTRDAGITWFGSFLQDYQTGGSPVAELNDLPSFIFSELIDGTFFRPIGAVRLLGTGIGETATGSTEALLNFNQFGDDWLISGLNSQFETEWIEVSRSGSAATLFGTTLGGFTSNFANQSQAWEKDSTSIGQANINLTIETREIANPGNTTGPQPIEIEVRIEA